MPALSTPAPARATLAVMTAAGIEQRDDANAIARGLERFRAVRRSLEEAVLPLATSLDGRRFTFQASLHGLELQLGGYVVIEDGDRRGFGQVLDLSLEHASGTELDLPSDVPGSLGLKTGVTLRLARGEGAMIEGDGAPFHDAMLRPATAEEVRAWTGRLRRKAVLDVGELALVPGVPCALDAGGFDRHTFLCGQSGSGKTYSLGVVLERLLLSTGLRIIVLDPNSDFARIASVRDGTDPATADAYRAATASIAVHSARGDRRAPAADPARGDRRGDPGGAAAPGPDRRRRRARRAGATARGRADADRRGGAGRGEPGRPGAPPARAQPRHLRARRLGPRAAGLHARRTARRVAPRHRRRPRLAARGRGAGAGRGGRPGRALAPARGAPPRADRDRRGAQRVPGRAREPDPRPGDRARGPDRRRGPASSGSTCSSPRSARRRSTRTSSRSATTCC